MRFLHPATDRGRRTTGRSGFTLIELMVVIGILLLVSITTVVLINSTLDSDRIRSGARQFQSVLAGARDRALHARAVRGVRLYRESSLGLDGQPGRAGIDDNQNNVTDDPAETGWIGSDDNNLVTRIVYIGEGSEWRQGDIRLGRFDFNDDGIAEAPEVRVVRGVGTGWKRLFDRGLLVTGSRIKIPGDATGAWYTVDTTMLRQGNYVQGRPEQLILTTDYLNPTTALYWGGTRPAGEVPQGPDGQWGVAGQDDNGNGTNDDANERYWPVPVNDDSTDIHAFPPMVATAGVGDYILQLEPAVLPNQEPVELPRNIAIDLMLSSAVLSADGVVDTPGERLNALRRIPPILLVRPNHIDILFSPRGTVTGPASAAGIIHFLIRDIEDATRFPEKVTQYPEEAPGDFSEREQLGLTLFTQTGNIMTHPVGPNFAQFWDYAERGEAAGQ